MRRVVVIVLAGCGFKPTQSIDGGPKLVDMRIDSRPIDGPPPDMRSGVPIMFERKCVMTNGGTHSGVSCTFATPQGSAHLNVVVVSWTSSSGNTPVVTDTLGNVYVNATGVSSNSGLTETMLYSANIIGGNNTVAAAIGQTVPDPKIRVFEYSGIATILPVDSFAIAQGNDAMSDSGPVVVTAPRALVIGANTVAIATTGPGPSFMARDLSQGDLVEDRIITVPASYRATAPLASPGNWLFHVIAFKGQ